MPREIMHRQASDNVYLHKDFHAALSVAIDYVEAHYGEAAVREYLRRFTLSYYAPLIEDIKRRGLIALKEHFESIYRTEDGEVSVDLSEDELVIDVEACPAVTHIRSRGYLLARLFYETTKTVNEALCERTPFAAELVEYEESSGRSRQRFYRKTK